MLKTGRALPRIVPHAALFDAFAKAFGSIFVDSPGIVHVGVRCADVVGALHRAIGEVRDGLMGAHGADPRHRYDACLNGFRALRAGDCWGRGELR